MIELDERLRRAADAAIEILGKPAHPYWGLERWEASVRPLVLSVRLSIILSREGDPDVWRYAHKEGNPLRWKLINRELLAAGFSMPKPLLELIDARRKELGRAS